MRLLLITSIVLFYGMSYSQNKKEQIEALNFSLDSLRKFHLITISKYTDTLYFVRGENSKLNTISNKQDVEIESLKLQSKNLQDNLNKINSDKSEIQKELNDIKTKQAKNTEEIHYYSLVVNNDNGILNSIKAKLLYYPEKTTLSEQSRNSKSFSELKECRLWKKDSVSYAFVIVKDTKKVPNPDFHEDEGDLGEIGNEITFNCYVLNMIDSEFHIEKKWNYTLEKCFLTAESQDNNIDFHLTDLNKDNKPEIWYVLESFCSLGVEPYKIQICLFNNSTLHTMESVTNWPEMFTDDDIQEWIKDGSKYSINKFDPNFEKLSQEFKLYAIGLRNKNLYGSSYYWR